MSKKKIRQQMQRARQAGMSPVDVARMRAIAKKEAKQMEATAAEQAFLAMLAIPLNVLVNDYWPKSAKKRAPKFIEDVLGLFEAWEQGVVTNDDLKQLLQEYAGVSVEDIVLQHNEEKEEE